MFLLIYLLKSICSSGSRGCCAASPSLRRGKSPLSSVLILVRPRHTGIPSSPMRMRKRNVQMQPHNWQCFIHSGLKRALKMACLCLSVLTQQRPLHMMMIMVMLLNAGWRTLTSHSFHCLLVGWMAFTATGLLSFCISLCPFFMLSLLSSFCLDINTISCLSSVAQVEAAKKRQHFPLQSCFCAFAST